MNGPSQGWGLTSRYSGEPWGEPSKRARQLPRKRSIAVGVRGNLHAGNTRISGTVPVERWVSGLKVCRLSMSAADPLNIAGTRYTVTPGTTVPRRGRVVYLDAVPVASKHGRDPHERGSRPYHRMGCPQGPAPSRRRGQPALGGRRGTTTPVRRAALQRVGAFPPVPAGRRTLDRHRRISRRGTGHHPQDSPLSAHNHEACPSNRPGAGPVSERHITTRPSGETVPELRTRAGSPIP